MDWTTLNWTTLGVVLAPFLLFQFGLITVVTLMQRTMAAEEAALEVQDQEEPTVASPAARVA